MYRPIGDLVLSMGVCLFASWTLLCYVMVFSSSGFSDLLAWSFLPVIAGLALGWFCAPSATLIESPVTRDHSKTAVVMRERDWQTWLVLLLAPGVAILRLADAPNELSWGVLLLVALLVFRRALVLNGVSDTATTIEGGLRRAGIAVVILLGVALAALTHRYDHDDAQYLNFVVTALDFPLDPLFSYSGLWQDRGAPLEFPLYRLHSYELLVAATSEVTGTDHKFIYYMLLPPLFGGLAVYVHLRLAQYLVPNYGLLIVLAWLVLIIALGESHRSFGNFAFVRLYQGKGLLATVFLPMCLLLGLRFAQAPSLQSALLLGMASVASLGMSSSALVTVPVVLAGIFFGSLPGASRVALGRILFGGIVLLFIGIAAAAVLITTLNIDTGTGLFGGVAAGTDDGLATVLGDGVLGALMIALFPLAPLFVTDSRRRRVYAAITLFFVVAVLNPWLAPAIAAMFDVSLKWRVLWSVPLVISASVSLVGCTFFMLKTLPQPARVGGLIAMLVAILFTSNQWSTSSANGVEIALPHYKVDRGAHALAAEIVSLAPPRSIIYAPVSLSLWVPTFRHHPYPLIIRPSYWDFPAVRSYIGMAEINRRSRVLDILEGNDNYPTTAQFLQAQLAKDHPFFVAYEQRIETAPIIAGVLADAGYIGREEGSYWLWQRQ